MNGKFACSSAFFAILLIASLSYATDPLTTSAAVSNGSAYSFGSWAVAPVLVTLACAPGGSDCANVSYCIDASNTCNPASGGIVYAAPVNVSTEGVSYIRYASNNSTGGWGDVASGTVRIDSIAPAISISDDASGSWTNNDTIAVSVSDSGSGVAETKWAAVDAASCNSSQDAALDAGTNSTSMQANSDSLYQNRYICFRAVDGAGNKNYALSTQITHLDTTAPVVNAGADQNVNSQFTENGAASDSGSGVSSYAWSMVSGPGTVTFGSPGSQGTTVSVNADGAYVIMLNATDAAGNSGTGSFKLNWITSAPTITVTNPDASPAQYKMVSASVPSGTLTMAVTSGSACDSSLSFTQYAGISFSTESDNGKKVCYRVVDAVGNTAYRMSSTISGIDNTKPAISLNGNSPTVVEVHTNYVDPGATAIDNHDGNISAKVVAGTPANKDKVGTYTVTYEVTDAAGNYAGKITRTVSVVDTTRPVISILGNSSATVEIRSVYTDAGATATDNYDGDVTAKIATANNVNTDVAGVYTVTYDVTDASGNKASQAVRTVTVVDSTLGMIGGIAIVFVAIVLIGGAAAYFLFMRKKHGL